MFGGFFVLFRVFFGGGGICFGFLVFFFVVVVWFFFYYLRTVSVAFSMCVTFRNRKISWGLITHLRQLLVSVFDPAARNRIKHTENIKFSTLSPSY